MAQIYLAGPFFSEDQIARIEKVEQALTSNPTVRDFFSPRKHQSTQHAQFTKPWATEIYQADIKNLRAAEAVVAIIDFTEDHVDSGTAFEIGYAVQLGTPVIVLHEKTGTVNLMIGESLHAYLTSPAALSDYDFNTLPANEYDGEFI
ncbi:nucleoside 2-deoxyribosyltransferase [Fructilactobacillus ixorae]|uniref:Nucleoside 2-deoxyribosyltransferase n=1 Tax=Fructilactobacillus ixorae TaxID=1750535 RepID=A0ABY5C2Q6_9LACO|nr:nucleoside 2-deoxyribosyltransferase [Fructilactobacillus ixorae]USS93039.1 nucleoside 2-deoxyribosyltransferase [Fructilactobacillus ixorae]